MIITKPQNNTRFPQRLIATSMLLGSTLVAVAAHAEDVAEDIHARSGAIGLGGSGAPDVFSQAGILTGEAGLGPKEADLTLTSTSGSENSGFGLGGSGAPDIQDNLVPQEANGIFGLGGSGAPDAENRSSLENTVDSWGLGGSGAPDKEAPLAPTSEIEGWGLGGSGAPDIERPITPGGRKEGFGLGGSGAPIAQDETSPALIACHGVRLNDPDVQLVGRVDAVTKTEHRFSVLDHTVFASGEIVGNSISAGDYVIVHGVVIGDSAIFATSVSRCAEYYTPGASLVFVRGQGHGAVGPSGLVRVGSLQIDVTALLPFEGSAFVGTQPVPNGRMLATVALTE